MKKISALLIVFTILSALTFVTWVYAMSETKWSPKYNYKEPITTISWTVEHSIDSTSWNTIDGSGSTSDWFCRVITTSTGYSGSAIITWQLQKSADGSTGWSSIGSLVASNVNFDGTTNQPQYATSTGTLTGNHDWAEDFTGTGYYQVEVSVTH